MHDDAYIGGHSENNIKCVMHDDLGLKNCVTGFTSDFLSFIDAELIRFFHRALQLTFGALTCFGDRKDKLTLSVLMAIFQVNLG